MVRNGDPNAPLPPNNRIAAATAAAASICLAAPLAEAKTSIIVTATKIFGTIDPAKIKDYTEYMAAANLYEGLTIVDAKGKVMPLLAEKWDISDDSKKYTFHLVKNAISATASRCAPRTSCGRCNA